MKFMRAREVPPFLRENGFQIGDSTFEKLTAPSINRGPPFHWWGPFKLFGDETVLEWAKANLSPEGPKPQKFRALDCKERASEKELPGAGTPGPEQPPIHQDKEDSDVD